jgi:Flp pilus assembly protein CpaB
MRLLIFFIAIALAVGAFFFTLQLTSKEKTNENASIVQQPRVVEKEQPKTRVFVAREDIPIGAAVKRSMLDIVDYQQNLVLPDMATVQDPASSPVDGMIARSPVVKGSVIMKSQFANPKDPSLLAAALGEGMRLVTINVDSISGDAGFVYPGDHVDVIITRDIPISRDNRLPVSEVLIPNVRVLAVNQKSTVQAGEGPTVPSSVSLEVSQLDAERVRLAENGNGKLSLALRALKDKDSTATVRPSGIGDLSRLTSAAYFPVLYDNMNSYTPQVITTPPGQESAALGEGNTPAPTVPALSASSGSASSNDENSIEVIRGTKKESIQIPSSSSTY